MLLIVQPGSEIFRGASLLALMAACIYAAYQIMTRMVADDDAGSRFLSRADLRVVMKPALPFFDIRPNMPRGDAALVCVAGCSARSALLFILAFQRAPARAYAIPYISSSGRC